MSSFDHHRIFMHHYPKAHHHVRFLYYSHPSFKRLEGDKWPGSIQLGFMNTQLFQSSKSHNILLENTASLVGKHPGWI
ncbi:predicted protein [Lichtheimia corymbifera JMRC:FSU:9682]|uniref:Uncharacterized protein n=1 Tax=Lichtheimia corymbifera JMRC:FSU:9682 TaxID=1263082 RepID=A0A068SC11_9FUNG|nr:predicted protein [Lichtheimia corymbifera JMRC:FSU:9682]